MNRTLRRWGLMLAVCLVAPLLMAPGQGLISKYKVNGEWVISGTTADEMRAIAGEPLSIVTPPRRDFERHWEYRCDRAGIGPCRTVAAPGKRRMVVIFVKERVDRIVFSPVGREEND